MIFLIELKNYVLGRLTCLPVHKVYTESIPKVNTVPFFLNS